ncbi:MAG: ArsB/NhaD family transporter [Proteobacteria bacterium]|nr:ArsB/NhaD family transporter [Desulfobacteraceae bacterium]MBU4315896.1 ArsB/NhaD family transporter [Pseudomonadota bacterium]MBU4470732.1 ArsB/NhaD family transporter [Pseudomonadota bacterium]MCG2751540.1 ArsB/NhaD family transporter [Desulfobacteraceae bacterium]
MSFNALIPVFVFVAVYVAISFEWLHKATAAVLGVMILFIFGVIDVHSAAKFIDFETIMLLIGMMGIVGVLKKSGFFTILTVRIAKLTRGEPVRILVMFSIATAVLSAFLDNVTTVLIMVPIIIELTRGMGLDPKIYVVALVMASNLGGTATLIGDPPNIIIGSKVGLTFNQFISNLFIPVVISSVSVIFYFLATNRSRFKPIDDNLAKLFSVQLLIEKIDIDFLSFKIDRPFLIKSISCMGVALLLFVTHTITHLSAGVVALTMAMILFSITRVDVEHMLLEVEWSTLLFFAGLFILVGAMEEKGVIEWVARNIFLSVGDNPYVMVLMVLWVSGIASGFIDNIPFTITMIPIVNMMLQNTPIPNNILWWALSLGACFGGNLTLIGASANIVSVAILKRSGEHVTFGQYMRWSAPGTILSLMISSIFLVVYLWIYL